MSDQSQNTRTSAPSGVATRKMVGFEEAMRITDVAAPFSVVTVLRVDGSLPAARVRAALDALQRSHPLLRARIVRQGKAYVYQFDVAAPIPLETADRTNRNEWIGATEDELQRRLDYAVGPLMRCRYLVDKDGGDLIVTIPHNILDAACAAPLFSELLALCAGQAPAIPGPTAEEGLVSPPSIYPPEYKGLRFAAGVAGTMAHQMADEMKYRWHARGTRKAPIVEIAKGHCRILPIRIPAGLTSAIIQATRTQRVTLNSILSAAMLSSVQRNLYPQPKVPLRHIIFTDMRPRLEKAVPPANLGCFLSLFRFTVMVERDGSFWDLTRQIQDSTVRAAHGGERYLANSMSPGMMKMIFTAKAFRMSATAVSYAGALDFNVSDASFTVSSVHAFAANMTLGPEFSGLVRLFRGELCWDLLYLDTDMDAVLAKQIADDILSILASATC